MIFLPLGCKDTCFCSYGYLPCSIISHTWKISWNRHHCMHQHDFKSLIMKLWHEMTTFLLLQTGFGVQAQCLGTDVTYSELRIWWCQESTGKKSWRVRTWPTELGSEGGVLPTVSECTWLTEKRSLCLRCMDSCKEPWLDKKDSSRFK